MTPEQINIAIAEWMGLCQIVPHEEWKKQYADWLKEEPHPHASLTYPPRIKGHAPDYYHDLNAVHAVEEKLDGSQRFQFEGWLAFVIDDSNERLAFKHIHATAPQRCEALLRTIGKWKEE